MVAGGDRRYNAICLEHLHSSGRVEAGWSCLVDLRARFMVFGMLILKALQIEIYKPVVFGLLK